MGEPWHFRKIQTGHAGCVGDHIRLRRSCCMLLHCWESTALRALGPATSTPILLWCTCGLLLVTIFFWIKRFKFDNSSSNRLGIATLCGYRRYRLKHATGLNKSHDCYNSKCAMGCNNLPTKVVISAERGTCLHITCRSHHKTIWTRHQPWYPLPANWSKDSPVGQHYTPSQPPCPTIANLRYPAKKHSTPIKMANRLQLYKTTQLTSGFTSNFSWFNHNFRMEAKPWGLTNH